MGSITHPSEEVPTYPHKFVVELHVGRYNSLFISVGGLLIVHELIISLFLFCNRVHIGAIFPIS